MGLECTAGVLLHRSDPEEDHMQCPSCGFANQAEMNFCGKCGTRLANVCTGCGYTNPPDHAFCGKCGTSITTSTPLAPG